MFLLAMFELVFKIGNKSSYPPQSYILRTREDKKSNSPHLCIFHYLLREKLVSSSFLRFASTKARILLMLPLVELPKQHGASATESLVPPHLPVGFKM